MAGKSTKNNAAKNSTTNGARTKIQRKKYTDLDREKALAIYATTGNLSKTSRETGIPISTLKGWIEAEPPEKVREARENAQAQFVQEAWKVVIDYVKYLNKDEIKAQTGAFDLARVVGILIDKIQLVTGQPTSNVKQEVQGQVTNRHEYDITLRDILERRAGDSASDLPITALLRRRDSITQ